MKKTYLAFFPVFFSCFFINFFNRIPVKPIRPKPPFWPRSTTTPTQSPTNTPPVIRDYKGEYFANVALSGTPKLTRNDQEINFVWNHDSPDQSLPADQFSVRWSRSIIFDSGDYTFTVTADDGVRLYIDNEKVLDQWHDQPSTTYTVDKHLSSGHHNLVIDYYEAFGGAVAKFSYSKIAITPTSTPTATLKPTISPATSGSWEIQSVSSMKETKDRVCGQRDQAFIDRWVDKAKELGVNYVAIETPYDSPACGNSVDYTWKWINSVRSHGLKVWHRHMPLAHEAIYDTPKAKSDYFNLISNYIKANREMFREGDIFTPIPEPQNGGISGVSNCTYGICQYDNAAHFNRWLRDALDVSNTAFSEIGLGGKLKIGYYGFDGFITWGSNNPDWDGIIEDITIQKMGHLAVDHYPELIGQTMKQGLDELQAKYPDLPIIISEWGSAGAGDVQQQVLNSMGAAKRPGVVGFNYWHMGMGGNEALINEDFSNRPQYDEVQSFFKGIR